MFGARERTHAYTLPSLSPCFNVLVPPARVGYRMDDTKEVETRAEQQLTRRYWRLLGGISDAILRVVAAEVEAATLAVRLVC